MTKCGSIYMIKNKKNGKAYIGQTTQSVFKRWNHHIKSKNNSIISKALKNNVSNFEFIELITCFSKEDLNYFEKKLISELNTISPNGYNLTSGGQNYDFTEEVKQKMRLVKLGKESKNHIVGVKALNVISNQSLEFDSLKEATAKLNVSRSSILKSCKYGIIRKNYLFSYANQSGSSVSNITEHAQRLEGEPVYNTEYNPSTSPRFPKKYMEQKDLILNKSKTMTPHAISKELDLDKSMVCYFVHCFGK